MAYDNINLGWDKLKSEMEATQPTQSSYFIPPHVGDELLSMSKSDNPIEFKNTQYGLSIHGLKKPFFTTTMGWMMQNYPLSLLEQYHNQEIAKGHWTNGEETEQNDDIR